MRLVRNHRLDWYSLLKPGTIRERGRRPDRACPILERFGDLASRIIARAKRSLAGSCPLDGGVAGPGVAVHAMRSDRADVGAVDGAAKLGAARR